MSIKFVYLDAQLKLENLEVFRNWTNYTDRNSHLFKITEQWNVFMLHRESSGVDLLVIDVIEFTVEQ